MKINRNQNHPPRPGFTLVELLVVITIIALLIALLGAVLANMGQQAKEAATNATIKKIHVLLEQRMEAFDRQLKRIQNSTRVDYQYDQARSAAAQSLPTGASTKQLDILAEKFLKRRLFPQRYVDTFPALSNPSGTNEADSAELLYHMLTKMEVGDSPPVDAGEFLSSETADTDEDGLLEFVDAWGNPLRFYRWPTRLFKPNGTDHDEDLAGLLIQGLTEHVSGSADPLDQDPDDPLGRLSGLLTSNYTPADFEAAYHTMNTYHLPLIVSAGPDGEVGLGEPYEQDVGDSDPDIVNFGYLAQPDGDMSDTDERDRVVNELSDNITNRNQRTGD